MAAGLKRHVPALAQPPGQVRVITEDHRPALVTPLFATAGRGTSTSAYSGAAEAS
jgi:hypothetical protein